MSLSKLYKNIKVNGKGKIIIGCPELTIDRDIDSEKSISELQKNETLSLEKNEQILKAESEAARIIIEAKQQAQDMYDEKKTEIDTWWQKKRIEDEKIIKSAKKEGFELGYSEGKENAENKLNQQYQSILNQANDILRETYEIKDQIVEESEPIIIELGLKIAEKVIKKELASDEEIIKFITLEALKNIKEFEKILIYVNPNDFTYLNSVREELCKNLNAQVDLQIYPDRSIDDKGCIIKTTSGALDARIDTQLEQLRQLLCEIAGR